MTQVSLEELLQIIGEQAVRIRVLERELAEQAKDTEVEDPNG